MISGNIKEVLNKETILSKIDSYNIFSYYLGEIIDFKKSYPSPFRDNGKDTTPNLRFFKADNKMLFKDFASDKSGDCFRFIMEKFKINYDECLKVIDKDFNLGLCAPPSLNFKMRLIKSPEYNSERNLIQIETRHFNNKELDYWIKYYQYVNDLKNEDIYAISKLYVNKQLITSDKLRFAYKYDNYLKIYSPYDPIFKWISNTPNDFISGFDKIKMRIFNGNQSKRLIITKSKKDELVLKHFLSDVCSLQNESIWAINEENLAIINKGYKPENVYLAFDNDQAGIENANIISKKYGFNKLICPEAITNTISINKPKDWADIMSIFGKQIMIKLLRTRKLI